MTTPPEHRQSKLRRRRLALAVAGAVGAIGIGTAIGSLLISPGAGVRSPAGGPSGVGNLLLQIGIGPMDWFACALASPLFVGLAERFPIRNEKWGFHLFIHVSLSAVLVLGIAAIFLFLTGVGASAPGDFSRSFVLGHLLTGLPPFGVVIAAVHAYDMQERYREKEVATAKLEAMLSEARMSALASQLRPHFLFNALQGISTLIYRDGAAADAMLAQLSDLLRLSLQKEKRGLIPLAEEMGAVDLFVGISGKRFGDRLHFHATVSEEAAAGLVPFFILQPLVENAFRHGIEQRSDSGEITINASVESDQLVILLEDDGPGLSSETPTGVGLTNVRSRLEQLFGQAFHLSLENRDEGGARVTLRLPYRVTRS